MTARKLVLPVAAMVIGIAFADQGLARSGVVPQAGHEAAPGILLAQAANMTGHATSPSGAPMTGSERGPGQATGPGPMVTSPSGAVPQTGSAAGVESPGSMPPGHMAADPNRVAGPSSAPGPMVTSPSGILPNTGSAAGAESPNSMPPGHMAADPNRK